MPVYEVCHMRSESASLTFSGGELKVKEAGAYAGYGVRALEDGKLGFAYCQRGDEVEKAVGRAVRLSRFSAKSGFSFAPPGRSQKPAIYDTQLAAMDYGGLRGYLEEAREAAESHGGKPRIMLSCVNSSFGLENTGGFSDSYDKTEFSIYAECMHAEGFGFAYLTSNHVPAQPAPGEIGLEAADMAKAMWNATKPESGSYTVVLQPEALDSILEILLPSFSGDWKRRKVTRLRQGAKQFSDKFTLCDDGLAQGTDARPFDDEGTPSARRPLVERGRVASFLFDRESAALANEDGSGACSREGYDSVPSIGQSNLVISAGDRKDFSDIGRHIEIHSMHGAHTANATTGDFGLDVSVAFLLESGKRTPLRGFLLAGNVFDMFAEIEAVEKGVHVLGGLVAPRMAFRGLKVVS